MSPKTTTIRSATIATATVWAVLLLSSIIGLTPGHTAEILIGNQDGSATLDGNISGLVIENRQWTKPEAATDYNSGTGKVTEVGPNTKLAIVGPNYGYTEAVAWPGALPETVGYDATKDNMIADGNMEDGDVGEWGATSATAAKVVPAEDVQGDVSRYGLVGEWKFDEGTGTTATDMSGSGNNGTISGATWSDGKFGNSLSFNGVDPYYVDCGTNSNLTLTNNLTIEAWIKWTGDGNSYQAIVSKRLGGGLVNYYLRIDKASKTLFLIAYSNSTEYWKNSTLTVPINEWIHVAVTFDNGNTHFYINSVDDGLKSFPVSSLFSNGQSVRIGYYDNSQIFSGLIDQVRIYNRALSATEVAASYRNGAGRLSDGLVAGWNFNEGTGTTVDDASGNGNNGTLTNGPTWVTRKFGKSLSFDGVDDYVDVGPFNVPAEATIDFWIYENGSNPATGNHGIIYASNPSNGNSDWGVRYHNAPPNLAFMDNHDGTTSYIGLGIAVDVNKWTHIAVVLSGSKIYPYKNGQTFSSKNLNQAHVSRIVNNLRIGHLGGYNSSLYYFKGLIDSPRIYSRALTAKEVKQHYEQERVKFDTNATRIQLASNGEAAYLDEALTDGGDYLHSFWYKIERGSTNPVGYEIITPTNLVTNGDMEIGDPPTGWTAYASAILDGVADEKNGGSGTQCMQFTIGTHVTPVYRVVTWEVGKLYKISGWVKNVSISGSGLNLYAQYPYSRSSNSASKNWTYKYFYITPSNTPTSVVGVSTSGSGGQQGKADNILAQKAALSLQTLYSPILLTNNESTGTSVTIELANTQDLTIGDRIEIEDDDNWETTTITAVTLNTSITVNTLANFYTTAKGATVNKWHYFETCFEGVEDGVHQFRFVQNGATAGVSTVYVDRVELHKNLINNGGMEGTYTDGIAPGWSKVYPDWATWTSDSGRTGAYAQKIVATSSGPANYQSLSFIPKGKWYLLSFWYKTSEEGSNKAVIKTAEANLGSPVASVYLDGSLQWKKMQISFKKKVEIYAYFRAVGNTTVWYDDVSLIELDTVPSTSPTFTALHGSLDDVRLYNRALSQGELQAHYERRKYNSTQPTTAVSATALSGNSYAWTVPADASTTVKVRVKDISNPATVSDISDNYFGIWEHAQVFLTKPAAGETLSVGQSYNIKWTTIGQGITTFTLKYATVENPGDSDWKAISSQLANDGDHPWTIPNDISTTTRIRIFDEHDALITDTSETFSIIKPTITITAPNGGESWFATGSYNITWQSTGTINKVKLEYSTNDGTDWTQIITNEDNDGTYPWTVVDAIGTNVRIRASAVEDATIIDTSNAAFSIIPPTITLTSPNSGEEWVKGTDHEITWTPTGGAVGAVHDNLTIQYSTNGTDWTNLTTAQANDGTYTWTIALAPADTYRIRILDATRPATTDSSDATFKIKSPYMTITAPVAGDSWVMGTSHDIAWTNIGSVGDSVTIQYSTDGGTNWTNIAAGLANSTATKAQTWTIPGFDDPQGTVKIKVTDNSDPAIEVISSTFAISLPGITVTAPNGGELWVVNDNYNITWTTEGTMTGTLKIEYSKDNFVSDLHTIHEGVNNTTTSYGWTIPDDCSGTVRVRITDNLKTGVTDKSNSTFTILPIPQLTITAPNGGETWRMGTLQEISWSDNSGPVSNNLTLEYSVDEGENWTSIATAEQNDGFYAWTIPDAGQEAKGATRVRIIDANRDSNTDLSNANFTIGLPLITITSPAGGEYWAKGDQAPVTWTSEGMVSNDLQIYYTTAVDPGAADWISLATGQANDASYTWVVPDDTSSTVKVRIVDAARPAVYDLSDATLTIIPYPTITLTSPAVSSTYVIGDTLPIRWTWKGLSISNNLTLEYYSGDYLSTHRTIATGVSNSGSYDWGIPESALASNNIIVRLSDVNNVDVTDEIDDSFRIRGGFTILTPNGVEEWEAKSIKQISWTTRGTISNVRIEYSLNSGSSWATIVGSVPNNGSYNWTVPDLDEKTNCRIRISDVTDATVSAASAADFSINYYTLTFKILDIDNYSHLQNLAVKCTGGGIAPWEEESLQSADTITHKFPYGTYNACWSKNDYVEQCVDFTADSHKAVTIYLESTTSAQAEWRVKIAFTYNAAANGLKTTVWMERKGLTLTSIQMANLKDATLVILEGETTIKTSTQTKPDNNGIYAFNWDSATLEANKTYIGRATIKYMERSYTSDAGFDVTQEKMAQANRDQLVNKIVESQKELEAKSGETLSSMMSKLESSTSEIKANMESVKTTVEQTSTDIKTVLTTEMAENLNTISENLTKMGTDLGTTIGDTQTTIETKLESRILNRDTSAMVGSDVVIRYRTYTGLSPVIDVYDGVNNQVVDDAVMEEMTAGSGVYESTFKLDDSWEIGDFTIVCSESTKNTIDSMILSVRSTDMEDIASKISSVMGTTSSLGNLRKTIELLDEQISGIDEALSKINLKVDTSAIEGIVKEVGKLQESNLNNVFNSLKAMSEKIRGLGGTEGYSLDDLYSVTQEKGNDVKYLKNKTIELKKMLELNKELLEEGQEEPIIKTWMESG
ncbi:MAG: LamG-like jellyroll fold domain-containing protein [bacterium]